MDREEMYDEHCLPDCVSKMDKHEKLAFHVIDDCYDDFAKRVCQNCSLLGEVGNSCKVFSIAMEEFIFSDVGTFGCNSFQEKTKDD